MINDDSVQSHTYGGKILPRSSNGANSVISARCNPSLVPVSEMDVAFTIFRVKEGRDILDWANQGDNQTDDLSRIVKDVDATVDGLNDTLAELQAKADKSTTPDQDAKTNADWLALQKRAADAETFVQGTLAELDRQCPDPSGQSVQQRYQDYRAEQEGHAPFVPDTASDHSDESADFDGGEIKIAMSQVRDDISKGRADE